MHALRAIWLQRALPTGRRMRIHLGRCGDAGAVAHLRRTRAPGSALAPVRASSQVEVDNRRMIRDGHGCDDEDSRTIGQHSIAAGMRAGGASGAVRTRYARLRGDASTAGSTRPAIPSPARPLNAASANSGVVAIRQPLESSRRDRCDGQREREDAAQDDAACPHRVLALVEHG